mmetsp:Transcript_2725/g.11017  ORF Transcript_2725/g.11017 Transcript_2725/m.11017 type:complete len:352 (+) Transcript_2725:412-1467(+)
MLQSDSAVAQLPLGHSHAGLLQQRAVGGALCSARHNGCWRRKRDEHRRVLLQVRLRSARAPSAGLFAGRSGSNQVSERPWAQGRGGRVKAGGRHGAPTRRLVGPASRRTGLRRAAMRLDPVRSAGAKAGRCEHAASGRHLGPWERQAVAMPCHGCSPAPPRAGNAGGHSERPHGTERRSACRLPRRKALVCSAAIGASSSDARPGCWGRLRLRRGLAGRIGLLATCAFEERRYIRRLARGAARCASSRSSSVLAGLATAGSLSICSTPAVVAFRRWAGEVLADPREAAEGRSLGSRCLRSSGCILDTGVGSGRVVGAGSHSDLDARACVTALRTPTQRSLPSRHQGGPFRA